MRILAPNKDYSGWSNIGPVALSFTDGVADYSGDIPEGTRAWLVEHGYQLEEPEPETPEEPATEKPKATKAKAN